MPTHDPLMSMMSWGGGALDGLLRDAVNGMAVLDLDGRFKLVNPAMCQLLGYEPDDLIGRRSVDITHPDDRAHSDATLAAFLDGTASTDRMRKRYVRPDGSVVSVVRCTTVLRDGDGRPLGLFTQVVNLTDMAEVEAMLRRSESRLQALLAHASEMTVLLDAEGTITYASPASIRLLGHRPEEVVGRSALDFLHPDDLERAAERLQHHISTPGPADVGEWRVRHSDGSWRHAEITTANLFDDPAVEALVLNIRDVTEQRQYQSRLEASERRFRALVGNSWDIITLHSVDGRYIYCSPAVTRQMGYRPEELIGTDPFTYIHPEDSHAGEVFRDVAAGTRRSARIEFRFRHQNGSWRWMESTAHNRLDDPAICAVVVTTRDVTTARRRAAQQAAIAALSSDALRGGPVENLFDHAARMVADILAVEHVFVAADTGDHQTRLTGGAGHGLGLQPPGSGHADCPLSDRAVRERRTVIWDRSDGGGASFNALRSTGVESAVAIPINSGAGLGGALTAYSSRPHAFSGHDLSFLESVANVLAAALTRRRIEEELRRQALHDNLTGRPNRILMRDRLETALSRLGRHGGSVALLFVDLDNFKLVNDTLGHSAGDAVVMEVSARITASARSGDTIARFGGDEFVVISEDADEPAARQIAERIRQALATPIQLGDKPVSITASVGVAVTADPGVSPDDLLAQADMAMYEAKQAGKDCSAMFAAHMRKRAADQLDAVSGMRRGLAEDEFRLFYQPIVDARTGTPVGSEALLRWQHPGVGLLGPDHFIDYAEDSGLIIPLGGWVLHTALRQSAAWRRAGRCSRVAINVSALQLTGSDIVAIVSDTLHATGAEPGSISLELTESAVMADLDRATATIEALKSLGVHVGMDDFGTGHSSLSHLARLPFDFVKIDRSFIRDFDRDARTAAMIESITTLCRALNLPAIAEGVETEEQRHHLQRLGVPYLQGFLFGAPAPPSESASPRLARVVA
ncbi:MAG TPA: EAL domain-containing protein [Acidimicrobiales bacterium]|nr:EAL domain-containing protein [Acidimicrobiales bacterium]